MMFRLTDLTFEPKQILLPIKEYQKQPIVSLDKAIEPLISIVVDIKQMVSMAKKHRQKLKDKLTLDESASITLYTLEWQPQESSFSCILNQNLRDENRDKLKPWFLYLRLFLSALSKLPKSSHQIIYRGVQMDLHDNFAKGKKIIWWGFASCTSSISTLHDYLGEIGPRTIFNIESSSAKDISAYTLNSSGGKEVLIYPARQFQVLSSLDTGNQLRIIHIKEIPSPYPFICLPSETRIKQDNDKLVQVIRQSQSHSISLREKNLTDDDIVTIVNESIVNKQCKELFLGVNQLTPISISLIAQSLKTNITLKLLDLSENPLGDLGLHSLTEILALNHSHLQYLYIYSTGITDQGVRDLANMLKTNTRLLDLDIGANEISDQGVSILANVFKTDNATLTAISFKKNRLVTDGCVDDLAAMLEQNQTLKFVNLLQCNLSSVVAQRLQSIAQTKTRFRLEINCNDS